MIGVRCLYENGEVISTSINGTLEEVRQYFEGKMFNIGNGERDSLQKCIKVTLINEEEKNVVTEILQKLEAYRKKIESGESTAGTIDHVIRMCEAHVATNYYFDRNEWTDELNRLNAHNSDQ